MLTKTAQKKIKSCLYTIMVMVGLFAVINIGRWMLIDASKGPMSKKYYQKCSVAKGCRIDEGDVSVIFRVSPVSLPVLQPLKLEVVLKGIKAENVSVEFVGRDMPMGLMPVRLERQWNAALVERYKGVGSISFCTTDNSMIWIARILIKTKLPKPLKLL